MTISSTYNIVKTNQRMQKLEESEQKPKIITSKLFRKVFGNVFITLFAGANPCFLNKIGWKKQFLWF